MLVDLPELKLRMGQILCIEEEIEQGFRDKRAQVSLPPTWGLVNICKLTGYYIDCAQAQSIIYCLRNVAFPLETKSRQIAMLRSLAVVGELTKYMRETTKSTHSNVPWKNIEKVLQLNKKFIKIGQRFIKPRK